MKVVIKEKDGIKIKLHIPFWKSFAGIGARIICSNRGKNSNVIDECAGDEIEEYIDKDDLPSREEMKKFLSQAIEILKQYKGLELLEVLDSDGDYVKITL